MLDIKLIRENAEDVIARLAAKGKDAEAEIKRILELDAQRREMIAANEAKFEKKMQSVWDELDAKNERESLGEQQQKRQNAMQQDNMDRQHQRNMEYQNQQNQYYLESQRINAPYQQTY